MIKSCLQFILRVFFKLLFLLESREKDSVDFDKVGKLYAEGGFGELFAKIRFWDAPIEDLEKLVPTSGLIVDLGCGDGLVPNYLALKNSGRQLIGIDKNGLRIKEADHGVVNTRFFVGDVLSKQVPPADSILMVHLLHHLSSFNDQEIILRECRYKLKIGGRLIIVEIDRKPLLKYLLTWIVDRSVFPILFEGKIYSRDIFYRRKEEWKELLTKIGFKVTIREAHQGKPFSHIILVGEKC